MAVVELVAARAGRCQGGQMVEPLAGAVTICLGKASRRKAGGRGRGNAGAVRQPGKVIREQNMGGEAGETNGA